MTTSCRNGHPRTPENTYVRPGRGWLDCNVCRKQAHKRETLRHGGRPKEERLPAEPLLHCLNHYAAMNMRALTGPGYNGQLESGMSLIARRYADRYGGKALTAERALQRIRRTKSVSVPLADELAILIGLHPVLIWGAEWFQWDAA